MAAAKKKWRIFARPLWEIVLRDDCRDPKIDRLLFLLGPRGIGKRSLINRLMEGWKTAPHATEYIDFLSSDSPPWYAHEQKDDVRVYRSKFERSLESLAKKGVELGCIGGKDVYQTLTRHHGINGALSQILKQKSPRNPQINLALDGDETLLLWKNALRELSESCAHGDLEEIFLPQGSWEDEYERGVGVLSSWNSALENGRFSLQSSIECGVSGGRGGVQRYKEAMLSLLLAKKLLLIQEQWRGNGIRCNRKVGGLSLSLANSCTNWPLLLVRVLSSAASGGYFQPKLIINDFGKLRKALNLSLSETMVDAEKYHDSLLLRLIDCGAYEGHFPIILVSSDSYYCFEAFRMLGNPNVCLFREERGRTLEELKVHLVPDYFSEYELGVIRDAVGSNSRHVSELYTIKQTAAFQEFSKEAMDNGYNVMSTYVLDIYLGYLQVTFVNPAMDAAVEIVKKFAADVSSNRVRDGILRFGAPWRNPPDPKDEHRCNQWAKLQIMDFVQAFIKIGFVVNYRHDATFEIMEDPVTNALIEVGVMYQSRIPQFLFPASHGIRRCLVRWLVQEKLQLNIQERLQFMWHRVVRGRYYGHLVIGKGL